MLDFSALRYPQWQERSEADFGIMFLEALSAVADELSYTQDRVAAATEVDHRIPLCSDGVDDDDDNCVNDANADQADNDGDAQENLTFSFRFQNERSGGASPASSRVAARPGAGVTVTRHLRC